MKERPILFSAPMVLALLAGRKTQTRRLLKPGRFILPTGDEKWDYNGAALVREEGGGTSVYPLPFCPYGVPGDRLWVRETWCWYDGDYGRVCEFRADNPDPLALKWRSSIHLPRRLSRIDLELTDVRVQRLQDISREDAKAEGMCGCQTCSPTEEYADVWNGINGAGSWDTNPWVWALTFRRVRP